MRFKQVPAIGEEIFQGCIIDSYVAPLVIVSVTEDFLNIISKAGWLHLSSVVIPWSTGE